MRNYTPVAPSNDPIAKQEELSYTFNSLVCRFTSEELAKYLRDAAARVQRESDEGLAKVPALRARVQTDAESAVERGVDRTELVQAVDEMEAVEKARTARLVQRINLVADHIAKDAIFEIDAREILNVEGMLGEDRSDFHHRLNWMRPSSGWRMVSDSKSASKTQG